MLCAALDRRNTVITINTELIGVLQNKPDAANEAARVRMLGTTKIVAGEAISRGQLVTATSAGKAEVVDAASEWYFGFALEAAAADGDIIEIMLNYGRAHAAE